MNGGIYQITNTVNGHIYIGSSNNIRRRFSEHKHSFRHNIHTNSHLQNAWNKYGEPNFIFKVLLYCDEECLLLYEQIFLDGLSTDYNIATCAAAPARGRIWSEEHKRKIHEANTGIIRSEETKRKMSEARMGRIVSKETRMKSSVSHSGKNCYLYGKHHSEETRMKISESMKATLAKKQ